MTTTPEQYSTKIQTYTEQFPLVLSDFEPAYVNHNKNPEYQAYTDTYNTYKESINTINGQLFSVTNGIQKNIDDLNKSLLTLDGKLSSEKSKNASLTQKLAQIRASDNGSAEMIDNSKDLYKSQYIINVTIFIGILAMCIMMYRIFRTSPQPTRI
jgi:hypothetical protein